MNRLSSAARVQPAPADPPSPALRALDSSRHDDPTARAEWLLLAAASRFDPASVDLTLLRSRVATPVNWDAVLDLAGQHGTSSLVYQNLARINDAIPSAVLASLRELHQRNIHKSLFLARELIRILDGLQAREIETLPYKGVVLSQMLYGDLALRQAGDIDLLVRPQDVARSSGVVGGLGFVPRFTIPPAAERRYLDSGYEISFDSPAGKNVLELQWALEAKFYAVDYDMKGLFQRAGSISVAGHPMKTPSPEDLLLALSVHAAKHVWGRLIWLCDIAQILKLQNLDWEWITRRAETAGIERILAVTLLLAQRFLDMPIPGPLETMAANKTAIELAGQISVAVAQGAIYEDRQVSYFRLMMRLRERRIDRLRFLSRLTFTPGPGEWEAVRLPAPLFPVYRLVRMGRLIARFARG